MRKEGYGGNGAAPQAASPATSVEAPIEIDGTYALKVEVVEAAYAALQKRRKEEAETLRVREQEQRDNQIISVELPQGLATRLRDYFGSRGNRDFEGTQLNGRSDSYTLYLALIEAVGRK